MTKRTPFSRALQHVATGLIFAAAAWGQPWALLAQAPRAAQNVRYAQVDPEEIRTWLTYLASDELQGRQVFTEGYGLAAQYVAAHLEKWGVKPLGANGSYLQPVSLKGYRVTRNSSVTLEADGQAKTFKHGDHVTFRGQRRRQADADVHRRRVPRLRAARRRRGARPEGQAGRHRAEPRAGTRRRATAEGEAARGGERRSDRGRRRRCDRLHGGAAPHRPPPSRRSRRRRRRLRRPTPPSTQAQQALRGGRGGRAGGGGARGAAAAARISRTVQRVDGLVAPQFTGDDTFFEALFAESRGQVRRRQGEGGRRASRSRRRRGPRRVTISIDNTYEVITQQVTHNVVGVIEGSDPASEEHLRPDRRSPRSRRLQPDGRRTRRGHRRLPPPRSRGTGGGHGGREDCAARRRRSRCCGRAATRPRRAPAVRRRRHSSSAT